MSMTLRFLISVLMVGSLLVAGQVLSATGAAATSSGCEWDGTSCGGLNSCLTTWSGWSCTTLSGCNEACEVSIKGDFGDAGPPTIPSGDWVECENGKVMNTGSGAFSIDETFVVGCPEQFDYVFNHQCDSTSGNDRCAASGGVIEAAFSGTCSECE